EVWRSIASATLPVVMYSRHAAVWMVNPGGTGSPALVISARPAPLPPSSSFILALPSAWPAPKQKTYLLSSCGGTVVRGLEAGITLIAGLHRELESFHFISSRSRRRRAGLKTNETSGL